MVLNGGKLSFLYKYNITGALHNHISMLISTGKNGADYYCKNGHAVTVLTRQS